MNGISANQLIFEKSPYLLQHAYNPVDWYPWGSAAFDKAKKEDSARASTIGEKFCEREPGAKCQIENQIAGQTKPNSLLSGNKIG